MEKQEGRDAAAVRLDDPWYDALASGWGELDGTGAPAPGVPPQPADRERAGLGTAGIYLEVHRSAAFQEVRSRYRRFVVPAASAFLLWYLAYVVTATTAPGLMARPVAGAVNVAMVAGLGQFAHHVPADLGVCPACQTAAGPGRARSALGMFDRARTQDDEPGDRTLSGDHQTLALLLFSAFIAITLGITTWASRNRHGSAEEFYAGGRLFSPMENGFAIAGDYMSAASFLGISGVIALFGYDGMLYSVGFLVAWLVVLLLVAELVRNCGRFTLADVVAARMSERPVRIAVGNSLRSPSRCSIWWRRWSARAAWWRCFSAVRARPARSWTVIGVGALMVVYVSCGGMRATTWIQIVKAVLLLGGPVALTVWCSCASEATWPAAEHGGRTQRSRQGFPLSRPAVRRRVDRTVCDFISLGLALVLGTAGLPHILSRFYTVPTARAARRSVVWSISLIGGFYLMTIVLGFGAAAVLGCDAVRASDAAGNTAVPLLALELGGGADSTGGSVLFAVVAAVAFATILAVVAGITLASSASVAHDLYASLSRRGTRGEVGVARIAAVGVGIAAIGLGLLAQQLNVAFLVGLAFAVAAAANLPVLLYALFWRRFTTRGAVWSVYGGLVPAIALVVLSPVVSGETGCALPRTGLRCLPVGEPGRRRHSARVHRGLARHRHLPRDGRRSQARGDGGAFTDGCGGRLTGAGRKPGRGGGRA